MKSLKARFNGTSPEVIEYTRIWGRGKAMDKYGVKDYVAFCKFIEEETGDSNFGLRPALAAHQDGRSWAEDLLDSFIAKLHAWEVEEHQLRKQLAKVTAERDYYRSQEALQLEGKVKQIMARARA